MTEEERLAEAAAYGRRLAEETLAKMDREMAHHKQVMQMIRESAAMPQVPPPGPTDLTDALREALEPRANRTPPSRPRLVLVKS